MNKCNCSKPCQCRQREKDKLIAEMERLYRQIDVIKKKLYKLVSDG